MSKHLPESAREKIAAHVEGILEAVTGLIVARKVEDFDACREAIDETGDDGTGAIYLDTSDWIALVAAVAADLGCERVDVPVGQLEQWLESKASAAVIHLAQEQARELVDDLEALMDKHGFVTTDLHVENRYGWAAHRAQREEDGAQVYEYRKVDGDVNVDVWEVDFGDARSVYLERHLDT